MSTVIQKSDKIIKSKDDLIEWFSSTGKPKSDWRIGTEHEKLVFHAEDMSNVAYSYEEKGKKGIKEILEQIASSSNDWSAIYENGNILGAVHVGGASISLEPGGQVELSGATLENIHQVRQEIDDHVALLKNICRQYNIKMLGMGHDPLHKLSEVHWIPRERYRVLRKYLTKTSAFLDNMMAQTTTVQVNLDYSSELDMIKKFQVSLKLQPLIGALFANSPFKNGKVAKNALSQRLFAWLDIAPDRSGIAKVVFSKDFGFAKWVDYILSLPMIFEKGNITFADCIAGKLGRPATFSDFHLHQTTVFTDVRLKSFLEMRSCDGQELTSITSLPAFWVGLLYDQNSLDKAYEITKGWSFEDVVKMRQDAPVEGLRAKTPDGVSFAKLARDLYLLAESGLKCRNVLNQSGQAEDIYLKHIKGLLNGNAGQGITRAEQMLMMLEAEIYPDVPSMVKGLSYF